MDDWVRPASVCAEGMPLAEDLPARRSMRRRGRVCEGMEVGVKVEVKVKEKIKEISFQDRNYASSGRYLFSITMLPDVSIRQLMIWQDFKYSSIQCQVETPDIM